VTALQIAEATCRYGAAQIGDGIGAEEARRTAAFVAGELAEVAAALYRLTRLGPADRARLARLMVGSGMTRREAAVRLGVTERTVRYYLAGGRGSAR
jgi:predicted transcriptional regulator